MKMRTFVISAALALLVAGQVIAADQNMQQNLGTDRVSKLMKMDVKGNTGQKLGTVSDAILDQNGRVSYLIVDHGGMLGIGDRLVPVPASAFHKGYGNDLTLNVDKARLEKAPNFASRDWPNFNDQSYDQKVNSYYGNTY